MSSFCRIVVTSTPPLWTYSISVGSVEQLAVSLVRLAVLGEVGGKEAEAEEGGCGRPRRKAEVEGRGGGRG